MKPELISIQRTLLATSLLSTCFSGCGGSAPAPVQQSQQAAPPSSSTDVAADGASTAPAASSGSTTTSDRPHRQNERWKDANGVEYLGNVPLDVFFDQPYAVASNMTPLAGSNPAGGSALPPAAGPSGMGAAPAAAPATGTEDSPPAAASGGGGGDSWSDLIAMKEIDQEITDIRNFLTEALQNVGAYNRSMLMIPPKAAAVGVLAAIVQEHPEDISWKEDAAYIRNFAKKMNEGTLQPGKKDQDRLRQLFDNMADTLNRSRPAGVEEPPATEQFCDIAEMRFVMMRMENSEKKLKTEVTSDDAFKSKKDMVVHEAAILATMTKVNLFPGYGYEDDEEFRGYAQRILDACKEIQTAAESQSFDAYTLALSKVSTACQECHSVFKNN